MSKKSIGREAEARHSESNGSPAPGLEMRTALLLLACTGVDARRRAQGAAMVGGRPPKAIVTTFCSIGDVFAHMTAITSDPNCMAGCAGGTGVCPPNWYPGRADQCSPDCGRVYEPFWDECGAMLTQANMGGMDEMGFFYDDCLEQLYPPGSCGRFCNDHTYTCLLTEIQ